MDVLRRGALDREQGSLYMDFTRGGEIEQGSLYMDVPRQRALDREQYSLYMDVMTEGTESKAVFTWTS
jgi:hypothetical protein